MFTLILSFNLQHYHCCQRALVADCVIRLLIAFGEWLKLNFNILSWNFISLLSVDIEWHGRNESCWPNWPENINWPSGPIFVQFDWTVFLFSKTCENRLGLTNGLWCLTPFSTIFQLFRGGCLTNDFRKFWWIYNI
jgi:hypothetical protein